MCVYIYVFIPIYIYICFLFVCVYFCSYFEFECIYVWDLYIYESVIVYVYVYFEVEEHHHHFHHRHFFYNKKTIYSIHVHFILTWSKWIELYILIFFFSNLCVCIYIYRGLVNKQAMKLYCWYYNNKWFVNVCSIFVIYTRHARLLLLFKL